MRTCHDDNNNNVPSDIQTPLQRTRFVFTGVLNTTVTAIVFVYFTRIFFFLHLVITIVRGAHRGGATVLQYIQVPILYNIT